MYKITVPINIGPITPDNVETYLSLARKCKADRVLFCGMGCVYLKDAAMYTRTEEIREILALFKRSGFETGIWIGVFGHGITLSGEKENLSGRYTEIEGVDGRVSTHGYCPLDENFISEYVDGVKKLAELSPDMILLDDDFRINTRFGYYMGCFCPLHLAKFYEEIGEEVPRDKIEELIFVGGKNKYRDAYMKIMSDSLLSFARHVREGVDEVDENIRLASCATFENWDFCGTDMIETARAFAGKTLPFIRVAGAPYWNNDIIPIIEATRTQFYWCKDTGIEVIAEGDTYPRPRYNVPSKPLELFDYALIASNQGSGILNYVFDYHQKPDYETGYIDRYVRNATKRELLSEIFEGKTSVGVRIVNKMHKIQDWDLPDVGRGFIADTLREAVTPSSVSLISKNSIPTSFDNSSYPVMISGEDAKYISESDLKNGAIIDVTAAKILSSRGIDTGIVSAEQGSFFSEYYKRHSDAIPDVDNRALYKIECRESAEILSTFAPTETPASYLYENACGIRFFVLAYDAFFARTKANFTNNYYRQEDLLYAIKYLCGKELPAVCKKNPGLYIYSASDENALSVLLLNVHLDDIFEPFIRLDREYSEIRFVNCSGRLEGNKVYLDQIGSYSMAAFEVK